MPELAALQRRTLRVLVGAEVLAALGVGWNAGLIAGSTLLAASVAVAERPRVDGAGEVSMGIAAARRP